MSNNIPSLNQEYTQDMFRGRPPSPGGGAERMESSASRWKLATKSIESKYTKFQVCIIKCTVHLYLSQNRPYYNTSFREYIIHTEDPTIYVFLFSLFSSVMKISVSGFYIWKKLWCVSVSPFSWSLSVAFCGETSYDCVTRPPFIS